jgi:hypothetical protein
MLFAVSSFGLSLFLAGCGGYQKAAEIERASLSVATEPCDSSGSPTVASPNQATLDMSNSREGLLRSIDGKPFCPQKRCDHRMVVLSPGDHEVAWSYLKSYSVLGPGGRDPVILSFKAEPRGNYAAVVSKGAFTWTYNCSIQDKISGRVVAETKDCDADNIRYPAMRKIYAAYGGSNSYIASKCYPYD